MLIDLRESAKCFRTQASGLGFRPQPKWTWEACPVVDQFRFKDVGIEWMKVENAGNSMITTYIIQRQHISLWISLFILLFTWWNLKRSVARTWLLWTGIRELSRWHLLNSLISTELLVSRKADWRLCGVRCGSLVSFFHIFSHYEGTPLGVDKSDCL